MRRTDIDRRDKVNKLAENIVRKIHNSNIGLPRWEIERIVQETIEQIEQKEMDELGKTVAGTE